LAEKDNNIKNEESVFQRNIKRGIEAKIISINDEKTRVTYYCRREYSTGCNLREGQL
jgi:hypothetical protein